MRLRSALWALGLCTACQGCSPIAHAVQIAILEPTEYSRRIDDCVDEKRNRALARACWIDFVLARDDVAYSPDFERGFEDGFADFLFAGGPGNPPPVPPRHYWRPEFENPEGQKAVTDWYTGFRHGAAAARASGYRRLVTIAPSAALPTRTPPLAPLAPIGAAPPAPAAPLETLPNPKAAPAAPPAPPPAGPPGEAATAPPAAGQAPPAAPEGSAPPDE